MASFLGFFRRNYWSVNPPVANSSGDAKPIKFGILGAANIAPNALIIPCRSHSEAIAYAIAARDLRKAEAFANKHGILKVYGGSNSYQELLNDPEVEAVYNPLPNGLHFEWTMKALAAGKHVLLEKPSANTANETRKMFEFAEQKGLILLEAFHYRFHPATQRVKEILNSGELGSLKSISANMILPKGFVPKNDIRYDYKLGGGALMDLGCYTMSCIRYLTSSNPTEVLSASSIPTWPEPAFQKVDGASKTTLALPNSAIASFHCDLSFPPRFGFIPVLPQMNYTITCDGGNIEMYNFVVPTIYHSITISTRKSGSEGGRNVRTEKAYTFRGEGKKRGEEWWSTYRFQLEAFVDKVRGRQPQTWVTAEDSIENMKWIEEVYAKNGFGSRSSSEFAFQQ